MLDRTELTAREEKFAEAIGLRGLSLEEAAMEISAAVGECLRWVEE